MHGCSSSSRGCGVLGFSAPGGGILRWSGKFCRRMSHVPYSSAVPLCRTSLAPERVHHMALLRDALTPCP